MVSSAIVIFFMFTITFVNAVPTIKPACFYETTSRYAKIECINVGIDDLPLDQLLNNKLLSGRRSIQCFNFTDINNTVDFLTVKASGNVTITQNGFANLKKIVGLEISPAEKNGTLFHLNIISSNEFSNTPNLRSLNIERLKLTGDAINAIRVLTNKIERLTIKNCEPRTKIIKSISEFTKLNSIWLEGMGENGNSPGPIFSKSALTLEQIQLEEWHVPKITKDMFPNMPNLWDLTWLDSNLTTIEAGAFDNLPKLSIVVLHNNRITNLPDGLFQKNIKLREVSIRGNKIENFSRDNFTHVNNFENFKLSGLQPLNMTSFNSLYEAVSAVVDEDRPVYRC